MLEILVLDTDHLVELDRGSAQGAVLRWKLEDARDAVATTITARNGRHPRARADSLGLHGFAEESCRPRRRELDRICWSLTGSV